jgi:hypothetical protein
MSNIWVYWETKSGDTKPVYLDLCYKTICKFSSGHNVILLNDKTVKSYLTIPKFYSNFTVVQRADWLRIELLKKYGGLWLDSDTIVLKPLDVLFDMLKQHDFVSFGPKYNPQTGVLLSKKDSSVMRHFSKRIVKGIDSPDIEWGTFGPIMLSELRSINYFTSKQWGHVGETVCYPVRHQDWSKFMKNSKCNLYPETVLVMLFNRKMYKRLYGHTHKQLMRSKMLISQLFRKVLL